MAGNLVPVDYDPFAAQPPAPAAPKPITLTPVDHDPFAPAPELSMWDGIKADLGALVAKDAATVDKYGAGQLALDAGQSIPAGAVKGAGSILSGAGELYDVTGRALRRGIDAVVPQQVSDALNVQLPAWTNPGQWLRGPGDIIQQGGEAISVPEDRRGLATMGGEGVGQIVPQIAGAVVAPAAAPAMLLSQGADAMADRAREAGNYGTAEADTGTILGATATGLSEKVGLDFLLKRVPPQLKSKFINRLIDMGIGGFGEAGSEVIEQGAQNAVTQQFIDPNQSLTEGFGESGAAGGTTGAVVRLLMGMLGKGGAGKVRAQSNPNAQAEINSADMASDAEIMDVLRGMGMTDEQIAAMSPQFRDEAVTRAQARQAEDSARPPVQDNSAAMGKKEFNRFQKELDRKQAEQAGVETGDINPAAVAPQPQRQEAPVMAVTPGGQAFVPDAATEAAQQLRSGKPNANALVPVDPNAALRRGEMTPDEVAQAQRQMEAGTPNMADAPARMAGGEGRAPQTPADAQGQREAQQAFDVAAAQRDRVGPDVRDTQAAGRPAGANAQPVYMDEGFPVQVIERTWVESNGKSFEAAKVQRYDPRTGKVDEESEPYLVPVKQLAKKNYATDPRQAQDVVERSQGPITPEQPRMAGDGNPAREPKQTYRATAPDPNEDFPAAGDGRSPLPAQPQGRGPWRQRSTKEDDYIRDFQDRQQRQQRSQESKTDYTGKDWGDKFSNKAAEPGADKRYGTDDAGHVASDKGGPIKFGDQKQAAKWILNVGHKISPDQFFEIANHPSGKGFTVREAGRSAPSGNATSEAPEDAPQAPRALPAPPQPQAAVEPQAEPEPQSVGAKRTPKVKRPDTLLARIRRWGGLNNANGDFTDLGKQFPGIINNKGPIRGVKWSGGQLLDGLGERLLEEGYAVGSDSDPEKADNQKVEALIAEMRAGKPVYSPADAMQAADYDAQDANAESAAKGDEEANRAEIQGVANKILGRTLTDEEIGRVRERMFGNPPSDLDSAFTDALEWEIMDTAYVAASEENALDDLPFEMPGNANDEGTATDDRRSADSQPSSASEAPDAEAGKPQEADAEPSRSARDQKAQGEVKTERTSQGEQSILPGGERTPQQKRDANRAKNLDVKDGLFATPKAEPEADTQSSLLDKLLNDDRGSLNLDDLADKFKKAGAGISRALFNGPLGRLIDTFVHVEALTEIVKGIRNGAINKSMRSPDGRHLITRLIQLAYMSGDGRMRAIAKRFKSETLNKVINQISTTGGNLDTPGMSYEGELKKRSQTRSRQVQEMLAPITGDKALSADEKKAMLAAVVRQVQSPRSINPATRIGKVAKAVQTFLKEELAHMKAAGVDIGEIKDGYYPREIDREAVIADQQKFLAEATKLYMQDPATALPKKAAEEAAAAWLANILNESPGSPHQAASSGNTAKFTAGRVFGKLMEQRLSDFLLQDPDVALTTYAYRAAKAAAIASRFGDRFSKWQDIEAAIIKEGGATAISELRDHVASVVGLNNSGAGMNSLVRQGSSILRTYTTLMLLEKAAISSLSEPFLAAARTGNIWDGLHAATLTIKDIFRSRKGDKSDMRAFAEDIGAIAGAMSHSVMAARYTGEDVFGKAQQFILAQYFGRTGLEGLTNSSIVAQAKIGAIFVRRLANDIAKGGSTQKSSRIYLREMGIAESDIAGFSKAVADLGEALPTMANMPGKYGDMARNAVFRFQSEVIQQPTRASRPNWANHPVGSVAFQLGAWSYSFSRNVLLRGARNAVRGATEKDLAAVDRARLMVGVLPGLALSYAAAYGLGELRDLFDDEVSGLTSPDGKSTRRQLTPAAKMERAASRAGLFGTLDPLIQLWSGARYGRDASSALLGPGVGSITGAMNDAANYFNRNSERTNTAERKLAGKFYDLVLEPTVNLALSLAKSNVVSGAVTVVAVPALKNAFVNEAAGEQRRKDVAKTRKTPIKGVFEDLLDGH